MANDAPKRVIDSTRRIQEAVKTVTASTESAKQFLKSAGIMTPKGNLSPKYR